MLPFHQRFQGLVFDCDGTLVDTMPSHFVAWKQSLNEVGISLTEERFYALGGVPAVTIIELLALEQGIEVDAESLAELKEERFVSLCDLVKPIQPIADIARAAAGTVPMAVATGSPTWLAQQLLEKTGLRDLFSHIIGADQVTKFKPEPETYLLAAQRIGLPAHVCCAFEDTDLGLQAARAAGMEAVDIRELIDPQSP